MAAIAFPAGAPVVLLVPLELEAVDVVEEVPEVELVVAVPDEVVVVPVLFPVDVPPEVPPPTRGACTKRLAVIVAPVA